MLQNENNLINELVNKGLEEKLREERFNFLQAFKGKLMRLCDNKADSKTLAKEMLELVEQYETQDVLRRY